MRFPRLAIFAIFLLATSAAAQIDDVEYGEPSDLRGAKTFSVDTYGDVTARRAIVAAIGKKIPELRLIDDFFVADIRIAFKAESEAVVSGVAVYGNVGKMRYGSMTTVRGLVTVPPKGKDVTTPRIVINFQEHTRNGGAHRTFVEKFVKMYRQANGQK